jgi:arabinan endo-1,5-alpha-L-arabinosidase
MVGRRTSRSWWSSIGALALVLALLGLAPSAAVAHNQRGTGVYTNPLKPSIPNDGIVESCADPTTFYDQQSRLWYTYCTTDPLNDEDKNATGGFNFHLIPILSSADLVHWTYRGDAFATRPGYATATAGLWAPEITYYPEAASGKYHLFYTVTDTTLPGGGSAIGVATSDSPVGPWTHSAAPAVEPHGADCCGPSSRRWVFDPEVLRTDGPDYIYYGSYFGGVSVRQLAEDGLTSNPATQSNVAIANKYEGPEVVFKNGFYYLFVSATDCCRGPLTGYSVFAGRSASPTGPFLDREGVDLNDNEGDPNADSTDARAGGTPVISMNGNRWIGTGHNTVFRDFDGQWWTIYHAVDQNEPYFEGAVGFTKRPALLDPVDWAGGWPTVRGGLWASDEPMPAPAAQPGDTTKYHEQDFNDIKIGQQLDAYSDDFNTSALGSQWSWVREPTAGTFGLEQGTFRFDTQAADLFESSNNAAVLLEDAPAGDYVVETKFKLNLPPEGCCFNFVQSGLVIYGGDDNFIKLAHVSIWNTRQTEFAKELFPVSAGYPRYGNTVVGPPAEWTYLRIVKRDNGGQQEYSAYTKQAGERWVRGGTWTHQLGNNARIGLVSMGGSGFVANFDYVRVYRL